MTHDEHASPLDQSTSQRLRKLSSMPVELAALQARIAKEIPRPANARPRFSVGWRGLSAVAASLAVTTLTVSLVIATSARPVMASPEALADVYSQDADPTMSSTSPAMANMGKEGGTVMACCIRKVGQQPLTCMTLDFAGKRVSMAVADAQKVAVPKEALSKTVGGVVYRYQSSKTVNMVMAVRGGAWVCMMGEVPVDDLIQLLARTPVR